jgi:hypothetical protein
MVIVFKAGVEHRLLLVLGQAFVFAFIEVSQTDVFHGPSPPEGASSTALRWIVHSIVVAQRKNRQHTSLNSSNIGNLRRNLSLAHTG